MNPSDPLAGQSCLVPSWGWLLVIIPLTVTLSFNLAVTLSFNLSVNFNYSFSPLPRKCNLIITPCNSLEIQPRLQVVFQGQSLGCGVSNLDRPPKSGDTHPSRFKPSTDSKGAGGYYPTNPLAYLPSASLKSTHAAFGLHSLAVTFQGENTQRSLPQ